MRWYLATSREDARLMRAIGKLRSLRNAAGKRCGCRPFLRLYASPELAAGSPNETPIEVILSVEGPEGAGERTTTPLRWEAGAEPTALCLRPPDAGRPVRRVLRA